MVEQEAVNFEVAGSSPASGAKTRSPVFMTGFLFWISETEIRTEVGVAAVRSSSLPTGARSEDR